MNLMNVSYHECERSIILRAPKLLKNYSLQTMCMNTFYTMRLHGNVMPSRGALWRIYSIT